MDTVKPALRVLLHAEAKGAQIGAAAGVAMVVPRALYLQTKPAVGGAACMAGMGMIVGGGVTGLVCAIKLARSDKAGIVDRAERLGQNTEQQKIDSACGAAAVAGYLYALKRISEMAESTPDATFVSTLTSRRGAWTMVSYVGLGVGVVFGAVALSKASAVAIRKIKESRPDESAPPAATDPTAEEKEDMLAAAVNGAADVVGDATEAASAAATKAVDEAVAATEEAEKIAGDVTENK